MPLAVGRQHPYTVEYKLQGVSCPSERLCVAVDQAGHVLTSTDPAGGSKAWTMTPVGTSNGVSCPSVRLCVAGGMGRVMVATDPAGGAAAWRPLQVTRTGQDLSVSCASVKLCIAFPVYTGTVSPGDPAGAIFVSQNPTDLKSWREVRIDSGFDPYLGAATVTGVACRSSRWCVAVDSLGKVLTSTRPTAGSKAWTATRVDPRENLSGIACPSASLCVAFDGDGSIVSSRRPMSGRRGWRVARTGRATPYAVSCPSVHLCVAVGGEILTSTRPADGARTWTAGPGGGEAVACPSVHLCVAVDWAGDILTSSNPAGGGDTWTLAVVDGTNPFSAVSCPTETFCAGVGAVIATTSQPTATSPSAWTLTRLADGHSISCPSASLCVVGDNHGGVLVSTDPTGGTQAWAQTDIDPPKLTCPGHPDCFYVYASVTGISCPATTGCVAVDTNGLDGTGSILSSVDPTGGSAAWKVTPVGRSGSLGSVSCPSASLCVAVGVAGIAVSANPTSGTAWKVAPADENHLQSVSCPTVNLCVAVDLLGKVLTSTNPAAGSGAWTSGSSVAPSGLAAISCPSASLCVAVGGDGDVVTSTDPTGGPGAWTKVDIGGPLTDVSCPSPRLCVAVDYDGNVLSGVGP